MLYINRSKAFKATQTEYRTDNDIYSQTVSCSQFNGNSAMFRKAHWECKSGSLPLKQVNKVWDSAEWIRSLQSGIFSLA